MKCILFQYLKLFIEENLQNNLIILKNIKTKYDNLKGLSKIINWIKDFFSFLGCSNEPQIEQAIKRVMDGIEKLVFEQQKIEFDKFDSPKKYTQSMNEIKHFLQETGELNVLLKKSCTLKLVGELGNEFVGMKDMGSMPLNPESYKDNLCAMIGKQQAQTLFPNRFYSY